MEDYEAAKLRMACLELAKQVAIAQCSGMYSIVSDAEKYWAFVSAASPKDKPAVKSDDDIPF